MLPAPGPLPGPVERFDHTIGLRCNPSTSETQVPSAFIDSFFVAAGWNAGDAKEVCPRHRVVIHQATSCARGGVIAGDRRFRAGPKHKMSHH